MNSLKQELCDQTQASYMRGCRCPNCRRAHTLHARRYVAMSRTPGWTPTYRRVDAAETIAHLKWLAANGVTRADLARATGIDHSTLVKTVNGDFRWVRSTTAAKILGVGLHITPGLPTVRAHIIVLLSRGWTQKEIGREAGVAQSLVSRVLHAKTNTIKRRCAERVLALDATLPPPGR